MNMSDYTDADLSIMMFDTDLSNKVCHQGPLLLTWINFNPSMDK